ncbi:hypothetical protein [Hafnia psychrotolerans]|uniref:hypothetical protein n=1 Tax=Hafnia psychrotolerans TaxID=1477018 RepID=UPI00166B5E2A|nr:hypothetical protein [Hafnia psychrotolerans]
MNKSNFWSLSGSDPHIPDNIAVPRGKTKVQSDQLGSLQQGAHQSWLAVLEFEELPDTLLTSFAEKIKGMFSIKQTTGSLEVKQGGVMMGNITHSGSLPHPTSHG